MDSGGQGEKQWLSIQDVSLRYRARNVLAFQMSGCFYKRKASNQVVPQMT